MTPHPIPAFLHRLESIVDAQSDALAIVEGGVASLTYSGLWERVVALGLALDALSLPPESVVGLALDHSGDHIVGMLGAWWAGLAFVPLDMALPDARLQDIARRSMAVVAVSAPEHVARLEAMKLRVLTAHPNPPESAPETVRADFDDRLAYVIFTSGSTGRPKGVMVEHRGIVALLEAQIEAFGLCAGKRALWFVSPYFDASISDIGVALLSGATLHIEARSAMIPGPDFMALVRSRGLQCMDLPPRMLSLMDPGSLPECVETIVIGGEPCPPEVVRRWARKVRLVNVYGPTEATVCVSLCVCDPKTWDESLLGQPIAGMRWAVWGADENHGELVLAGLGVARGYVGQAALTAEKFVWRGGARWYRTGDRVRVRDDGEVVFLGRVDRQVKLGGMLVAPEEVEARLCEHRAVRRAAVLVRALPERGGREGLVAFVVSVAGAVGDDVIRGHLSETLPVWMLPQRIEWCDALPLGVHQKVDFKALEAAPLTLRSAQSGRGPVGPVETALATIWSAVLGVESVGAEDDFFALGGTSLRALEVVAKAHQSGLAVTSGAVLRFPTIAGLAARIVAGDLASGVGAEALRGETDPGVKGVRGAPSASLDTLLLTGATGFLGSQLLGELLARSGAEIWCLVRAGDEAAGRARIRAALRARRLGFSDADEARVRVFHGDLAEPRMGVSEAVWKTMASTVDAVFHCAAEVNMLTPYAGLRGANVAGTRAVLALVSEGRPKALHFASTLSVFVATDRCQGVAMESDDLSKTKEVFGGYAQSKWVAEVMVRRAAEGLPMVGIHRLGLIVGDTVHGLGAPRDLLAMVVRGLAAIGAAPRSAPVFLDITPVDHAAAVMAHVALSGEGQGTFHIANPESLSLSRLIEAMRAEGVEIEMLDPNDWSERLSAPDVALTADRAAVTLALSRCLPASGAWARHRAVDLFQATGMRFDARRTQAVLSGTGLQCPPPDLALVRRLVRAVLEDS